MSSDERARVALRRQGEMPTRAKGARKRLVTAIAWETPGSGSSPTPRESRPNETLLPPARGGWGAQNMFHDNVVSDVVHT